MRVREWEVNIGVARIDGWGVFTDKLVAGRSWHVSLWPYRVGFYVAWYKHGTVSRAA